MDKHQLNFSDYHLGINDSKVISLIKEMGMEGYGIYISINNFLSGSDNKKFPNTLLPLIAKALSTTLEKTKQVVINYELFDLDGDSFSLLNYEAL